MSASMFVTETDAEVVNRAPAIELSRSSQLAVAREMITSLDTLAPGGRQHAMGKIVALLRAHVSLFMRAGGARNHQALAELVARLSSESERLWPDVAGFIRRAEGLVTLLAALD